MSFCRDTFTTPEESRLLALVESSAVVLGSSVVVKHTVFSISSCCREFHSRLHYETIVLHQDNEKLLKLFNFLYTVYSRSNKNSSIVIVGRSSVDSSEKAT